MLKIKVSSLKPGVTLGKDLFTYDSKLLLSKGTMITQEHLDNLRMRRINDVFIMDNSEVAVKPGRHFEEVYNESLAVVRSFMLGAKLGKSLEFDEINTVTDLLLGQVFEASDLFRQMRLMKEKDDYLFTHSVNVALLCILIGRWLKCDHETMKELGQAGLLHDIGKVFIDEHILNKPFELTTAEFEEVKRHTLLGYYFLTQHEWVSNCAADAAFEHHERVDGSGYPMGTKGYSKNLCASIVAVADVYDAITSDRVYANKRSPYTAAEILWQESFGKLDPTISKLFYDKITSFYVGNEVLLSNNEIGVVIYVDPSQPTRPIVMVGDNFYNLGTDRSITIMEVID